jgi:hypothetical protein
LFAAVFSFLRSFRGGLRHGHPHGGIAAFAAMRGWVLAITMPVSRVVSHLHAALASPRSISMQKVKSSKKQRRLSAPLLNACRKSLTPA